MFLSRFLVGIRGPVYVAAGAAQVPYRRFLVYDMVCASLVVTTFFFLAFLFGERVMDWIRDAEITATIAVVLIVTGVGLFLYLRSRRKVTEMVEKVESGELRIESQK
jgi:membrane protein DedA with SNARE-associated domain